MTEADPTTADAMIAAFFSTFAPATRKERAEFHVAFVRVIQQLTLEAARPYHMLLRDALAQQPLMSPLRSVSVPRDEPELRGRDE